MKLTNAEHLLITRAYVLEMKLIKECSAEPNKYLQQFKTMEHGAYMSERVNHMVEKACAKG